MQLFISNFWATDTINSGTNYEVTGEKFPTIIRVWGQLNGSEVSDRIAVFFDYVLPFNGVKDGLACNSTGEYGQKLEKCSGVKQTGPVFNADITQSHMVIYEFDKTLDSDKWFELIIPVSTLNAKFTQAIGFAVLSQSISQSAIGYYDIKELMIKRDLDYSTSTNTINLANDPLLKGVNYKLWFDYVATRSYYNGKAEDLTILLQHTDTGGPVFSANDVTDKGAGVLINFAETPIYDHKDFAITSALVGWEPFEQCCAYSYNYLKSTSPDVYQS